MVIVSWLQTCAVAVGAVKVQNGAWETDDDEAKAMRWLGTVQQIKVNFGYKNKKTKKKQHLFEAFIENLPERCNTFYILYVLVWNTNNNELSFEK